VEVAVNGTRLWFDVDGPSLVPAGSTMGQRPTVILLHGGPGWTFEVCADDVRAFCDTVGITRPVVYGHSMGGFVAAMLYAARHPGHAAALVLQSTNARFDLDRLVEGIRHVAGTDAAELARRSYTDDSVTPVAASREILAALPAGIGRLELIAGAGHFPWLDAPVAYWRVIGEFLATVTAVR
jgi:proline iminopeptidase